MKNLETKKLSREQMKAVLGGSIGGHCTSDIYCQKTQYCADIDPVTTMGYCKTKEKDPFIASRVAL